jgi:LAGLIDADG endonuclease
MSRKKTSSILKLLPLTFYVQKNHRYASLAQKKHPLALRLYPLSYGLQLKVIGGKGIQSMEGKQPIQEIGESDTLQAIQASPSQIETKVQDPIYKKLNSYLAGLFEGDGHIWLPNLKIKMKKKHNPRFCITFGLKNEPLAKKILEIIEYGHIRYKPKENACVLIVSPVKGLKKIIKLINGELRTPKIHQLHKLID